MTFIRINIANPMVNPYAATTQAPLQMGFFGDKSTRMEGGFLYRVIAVEKPVKFDFVYSGWWFRQQIRINEVTAWSQISWLRINNKARFRLPAAIDVKKRECRMEIDFSRGLQIRRFRLWVGQELVYDEVT